VGLVTFLGSFGLAPDVRADRIVISIANYSESGASTPIDLSEGSGAVEVALEAAPADGGAVTLPTEGIEAILRALGPSVIPSFRVTRPATGRVRTSPDGVKVLELSAEVVVETPDKTRSITYDILAVGELPQSGTDAQTLDLLIEGTRRDAPLIEGPDGVRKSPSFSGLLSGVVDAGE
jgi:hypothetical protein